MWLLKFISRFFIVSGIGLCLFILWIFVFGPEQYYVFDPYCDTVMAKDFSVKKLERIKPGMDSAEVVKILGTPLYIKHDTIDDTTRQLRFEYTNDGKLLRETGSGDQAWYNATVTFDSQARVLSAGGGWIYD